MTETEKFQPPAKLYGNLKEHEWGRLREAGSVLFDEYRRYRKAGVITNQEWALAMMYLTVTTSEGASNTARLAAISKLAQYEGMFIFRAKNEFKKAKDKSTKQLMFEVLKGAGISEFQHETFENYLNVEAQDRKNAMRTQGEETVEITVKTENRPTAEVFNESAKEAGTADEDSGTSGDPGGSA